MESSGCWDIVARVGEWASLIHHPQVMVSAHVVAQQLDLVSIFGRREGSLQDWVVRQWVIRLHLPHHRWWLQSAKTAKRKEGMCGQNRWVTCIAVLWTQKNAHHVHPGQLLCPVPTQTSSPTSSLPLLFSELPAFLKAQVFIHLWGITHFLGLEFKARGQKEAMKPNLKQPQLWSPTWNRTNYGWLPSAFISRWDGDNIHFERPFVSPDNTL